MSTPVAIDNPICVALDSDDAERVRSWAHATRATIGMYKVGLTAYIAHGAALVRELAAERPVFLDLKLHDIPAQVEGAAHAALEAGAAGFVCSPHEVAALRGRFGPRADGGPLLVVPGIRDIPADDDQRRTMSAKDTVTAGADIVVIGRPITGSDDPEGAARTILQGLQ